MKTITVFTDGACKNNGRKVNKNKIVGGMGIYFPDDEIESRHVNWNDFIQGNDNVCTNNKTELAAILIALRLIRDDFNDRNIDMSKYNIIIKTDSQYAINCVTKWYKGWVKNGWKNNNNKDVENKELIQRILIYVQDYNINFVHVDGHKSGNSYDAVGNRNADNLANNRPIIK